MVQVRNRGFLIRVLKELGKTSRKVESRVGTWGKLYRFVCRRIDWLDLKGIGFYELIRK